MGGDRKRARQGEVEDVIHSCLNQNNHSQFKINLNTVCAHLPATIFSLLMSPDTVLSNSHSFGRSCGG